MSRTRQREEKVGAGNQERECLSWKVPSVSYPQPYFARSTWTCSSIIADVQVHPFWVAEATQLEWNEILSKENS